MQSMQARNKRTICYGAIEQDRHNQQNTALHTVLGITIYAHQLIHRSWPNLYLYKPIYSINGI